MLILFFFFVILTVLIAYIMGKFNINNNIMNILLLLLLLIDILLAGKWLYTYVPIIYSYIMDYLINIATSIDVVILVAIITGFASIVTSSVTGFVETKNKRREYLSAKREEPYREFIELFNKLLNNGKNDYEYSTEEMIKDINDFNSKLTLWGSPKVVKKWNEYRYKTLDKEQNVKSEETLYLLEEVMNQMRKDLGVKSVGKKNLLSIFINDVGINNLKNK